MMMAPANCRASDGDAYVAEDWHRYRMLKHLVNHWDRPGWRDGTRSYHWLLSFDNAPALRALAARCQAELRVFPTLDLVPLDSLHITVQRAGFTNELSLSQATAIAGAARERCAQLTPRTLRIGPLAGSPGAVRFSAGPHKAVAEVRSAVQAAIAEIRGSHALSSAEDVPFIPHVSIAYSNAETPARPVIDRVATLRDLDAVTTPVTKVDLVELRREGRRYRWERIVAVGIGRGQGGAA
jgi:2'-5' RNA ligase